MTQFLSDDTTELVLVLGSSGLVGSSILTLLKSRKIPCVGLTRSDCDLRDAAQTRVSLEQVKPSKIILAAAKVGGILANQSKPVDFLLENLQIQLNVISAAHASSVDQLIFLGSSCIYPRNAAQPILESSLLTDKLESTNEPYAIAKIAGIKLCQSFNRQYGTDFRCLMPTNLYGPNDNFDPNQSHVIPGLINKFVTATSANANKVELWGTGVALREFLHVDDMAKACLAVMETDKNRYHSLTSDGEIHINVGSGEEISIKDLAAKIAAIVGYRGDIIFNPDKPDGTPRKLLDSHRIRQLGWQPKISLDTGLEMVIKKYLKIMNLNSKNSV